MLVACTKPAAPETGDMPPAPAPGEEFNAELNDDDMLLPPADNELDIEIEVDGEAEFPVPLGAPDDNTVLHSENGLAVEVTNLGERSVIESPLTLTGKVRRDWMFEGSFPITIMTLEGSIVKEWYGEGAWLEPIAEDLEPSGNDMIEFTATIDFEAPAEGDGGKIRFAKDLVGDDPVEEYVEMMVLWP